MGTGYNGLPNIKMEDGISSIGVKVKIHIYSRTCVRGGECGLKGVSPV